MIASSASTNPNVHVGVGEDSRLALVAFTGGANKLFLQPFDFMDLTGTLQYSRILLRDPNLAWFHLGVGGGCDDFDSILQLVREKLSELGSEKVMTLGTSLGGYAALLAGHRLGADYVHAFGPQTYLDQANIRRYRDRELGKGEDGLDRVYAKLGPEAVELDLRRVLEDSNGKTRFFVHACAGYAPDLVRAAHLEGAPGVTVLRYPCSVHNVLIGMAHKRFLRTALTLEAQDTLPERHAEVFAGTEPQPRGALSAMDSALGIPRERVATIVRAVGLERLTLQETLECPDLVARLGFDSMDMLEIIVGLETEFGIEVDPETVAAEDFRNVSSMLAIVWAAAEAGSADAASAG